MKSHHDRIELVTRPASSGAEMGSDNSSCIWSRKYLRNSWESCCWKPRNMGWLCLKAVSRLCGATWARLPPLDEAAGGRNRHETKRNGVSIAFSFWQKEFNLPQRQIYVPSLLRAWIYSVRPSDFFCLCLMIDFFFKSFGLPSTTHDLASWITSIEKLYYQDRVQLVFSTLY